MEGKVDKSDVELSLDRNDSGEITKISYKINDAGVERHNVLDFLELVAQIFTPSQDTYNLYSYDGVPEID